MDLFGRASGSYYTALMNELKIKDNKIGRGKRLWESEDRNKKERQGSNIQVHRN
jgi:hypothetical protein